MQSVIVISPMPGQLWMWAGRDVPAGSGSLADLADWHANRDPNSELVLLVPGEDVLLAHVSMPTRVPSRLERALPFALEEHVLADPATLHCVPGPWLDQQTLSCAAISHERLDAWLQDLASHGIVPDRAVPDALCVPWRDNVIHAVIVGDRALIRWGESLAAVSNVSSLAALTEGIRAEHASGEMQLEKQTIADSSAFVSFCASRTHTSPIDLLQGEFMPARRQAGWRAWRLPAALAGAVLLALVSSAGLQNLRLSRDSEALSGSITAQFRELFPGVGRVQSDPAPQVALELRRLRQQSGAGGDRFLELLAGVAPALSASPDLRLERLQYRDGQLELGIAARQIADLDELRARLQSTGISASQGAAQLDQDRVSGTLTIRPRAGGTGPG